MITSELVQALQSARRRMTSDAWRQLASKLATMSATPNANSIREATAGQQSQDAAWLLTEAFRNNTDTPWIAIAAAMMTVDCLAGANAPLTELIWTGPANNRFPVRRLDQVLYDLIAKADKRIVLVTFAAHRVRLLCDHLTAAVKRGVTLTLIVESEDESEGQLTRDAIEAFRNVPTVGVRIYYWPLARRERNQAGRPGKLHMKCVIVDDVALIGSANLTDDAFNRNMELGLLVREEATVTSLAAHFSELIRSGVLVELPKKSGYRR
jgi:phosphatidylserine/phosphatidylglycerophosphate/cardiolipin synthase-like enzyme